MASLAVRVPEKSIERNNGSELSTWSLWRPSLQQLPYPFCNNYDKHTASQARLHLSGDGNPVNSEINNFSHWAWEKEGSPHSWCRCPLSSCSHREQSLAYKRRIPQADSRLNPHRARCKLKGHSLVFSRLSLCACESGQRFNKCHHGHVGTATLSICYFKEKTKWDVSGYSLTGCSAGHRGCGTLNLVKCAVVNKCTIKRQSYHTVQADFLFCYDQDDL